MTKIATSVSSNTDNYIRSWRRAQNLSIKGLAKILSVSQETVESWETGAMPNKSNILKLAGAMAMLPWQLEDILKPKKEDNQT